MCACVSGYRGGGRECVAYMYLPEEFLDIHKCIFRNRVGSERAGKRKVEISSQ